MDQQKFYIVMTVAAAVIALSFIVQAAMFLFIYGAIKRLTAVAASLQAKAEPLIDKAGPLIDQVQGTISTVKDSVERISIQAKDAFEKVQMIKQPDGIHQLFSVLFGLAFKLQGDE